MGKFTDMEMAKLKYAEVQQKLRLILSWLVKHPNNLAYTLHPTGQDDRGCETYHLYHGDGHRAEFIDLGDSIEHRVLDEHDGFVSIDIENLIAKLAGDIILGDDDQKRIFNRR